MKNKVMFKHKRLIICIVAVILLIGLIVLLGCLAKANGVFPFGSNENKIEVSEDNNIDPAKAITYYSETEVDNNEFLRPIGKTNPYHVIAAFNNDYTEVVITKNGKNSDGLMQDWNPFTGLMEEFKEGDSDWLLKKVIVLYGVNNIGTYAFNHCLSLTEVSLPEGLTDIGKGSFDSAEQLEIINFPSSLVNIGGAAFYNTSLEVIDIPENVKTIGNDAFGRNKVFSFTVNSDNACYASKDGVLFNKDKTTLIQYPACKPETEYAVPDTVKTIETTAFYFAQNLKSVDISNSVISIGGAAFMHCSKLSSIKLPNNTTIIGSNAFSHIAPNSTIYCESQDIAKLLTEEIHYNSSNTAIVVDSSKFKS